MNHRLSAIVLLVVTMVLAGCANITAPTGGKKDTRPPKLVSIDPKDSIVNTKVKRIEIYFDEYITVSDPAKEVQLSPILAIAPTVTGLNKHVIVKIVDSLLEANTTYRLSFGNSIKDLHEGNVFKNFTYTFSTGAYFDSLQLHGTVIDAATGLQGMEGVTVELYSASENDSAVVRHKPKYVTKADASGSFTFKGLPRRTFRIYAIKDANDNLVYDGPGPGEFIGFMHNSVVPNDSTQGPIILKVFAEIPDTAIQKGIDSLNLKKDRPGGTKPKNSSKDALTYSVGLDTSNVEHRSFDITAPIKITFSRMPAFNYEKITLTYDSSGVTVPAHESYTIDTVKKLLNINSNWRSDKVYTLRLVKGFAKDTSGADVMPSRYVFHTKSEEDDYTKVTVHLPSRFLNSMYLFRVMADNDSVYQKPVTDTVISLTRLKPGKYTFRIIADKNRDGKWNTGDLFKKIQPEEVITYPDKLNLKPGWDNSITDWDEKTKPPQIAKEKDPKTK